MSTFLFLFLLISPCSSDADPPREHGCFFACLDCREKCHGVAMCNDLCYLLKRACCEEKGFGQGSHRDCMCQ